jgi:hypothetical protein
MGEDAQNLSKMSTNVFANTSFFMMELFTTFLATGPSFSRQPASKPTIVGTPSNHY